MDPQFEELARKVATEVIEQLSPKLKADVTDAVEAGLEQRLKIHFESMQGLVKLAAEGYGATLGSIDRRLKQLETKWDTKISDHDRVLANHNERLASLAQKRR